MDEKLKKCFWCDTEIPKTINKYEPCEKCKKIITEGILFIEVQDIPMQMDQPTLLMPDNYPTGCWLIFKPKLIEKIFDDKTTLKILRDKIAFLDRGMFENLGLRKIDFNETIIH